ncbi:hypothetical protein D9757_003706 [Collybiopsis confluens]|uniref:Uncharacterized protein n=1 Tax=Collybiopsis confluens TaxID=2823264 RepID=A0A8H5MDE8_9AGAR|nr:hypothetical protein D9757_003706 [Collybiopsis confluens]
MKHIVLDALNQFKLDDKLPHTDQDAEKWDSLVQKVVENEGALNAFVDFWPIKAYFDFYTTYKARALGRTPRKRKKRSDIPEHMRVQSTRIVTNTQKYVGLRPPSSEHFADPPSRSYGSQRHKKLQRQRSPSIVWVSPGAPSPSPAPYYLAFESAFDKEVRQPCWVCRSVPEALHAYRLRELFQNDSLCKQELSIKIGLRCDLDLDTLLSLNRPTRDELFRETEMNTTLVQRINKILASEKPQAHAILNIAVRIY